MKDIELWQGDCLELMTNIPDKSVDMIFTDLPYNTTQNSWDCMINLDELWKQYKRIIKKNGCIALWAQAPFSHVLALSNISQYRYKWIIEKTKATGHLNAKRMPMKAHENVMVFADLDETPETLQIFYGKLPTYNPQMTEGHTPVHSYTKHTTDEDFFTERLKDTLMNYFDVNNDSCAYNLTRDKEAFNVGTMTFEDFEEFSEEIIDDIVDYIKRNI